jgi:hypothetical protein
MASQYSGNLFVLDLSALNLDGTQSLAKRGGEKVAYQGRKKGKTSNILPITDRNGYVVASTGIMGGNHNDSYELKPHLQAAFQEMKKLGLSIEGAYFTMPTVPSIRKKVARPASTMA